MKKLRLKDTATAEEGYHDTVRTMARKPYPGIDGMRNVQRLLKIQTRASAILMSKILSTTATSAN